MPNRPPRGSDGPKRKLAKVVELRPHARRKAPIPLLAPLDPGETQTILAEMALRVPRSDSVSEALHDQLTRVQALVKAKAAFVVQAIPGRDVLEVASSRGRADARVAAARAGEGPVGEAFSMGVPRRADGVVAAPLPGSEEPLGCLVLVAPRHEVPDALLSSLAAHVAASMEFARVRDEAMRRSKDLQTAIAGLKSIEQHREQLISSVSHDLKNPLSTIKTYLALLSRPKMGELNEQQLRAIQICDRNTDRLSRMVNDLLLLSRLQSGKMQLSQKPFGLKALAEEAVRSALPIADPAKIDLTIAPSAEVFVKGDRERMLEALYNLIEFAVQLSPEGGTVELKVREESGLATVTVRQSAEVSSEDLRRLFEPYYRPESIDPRRYSGGLELPIVARIVHLHGGRVDAFAQPRGTAFQLHLPMYAGAISPARLAAEPRAGGILVVEDDADSREVLTQVLEDEGYRVIPTASASDALSILENIRPAMVLLDLRLGHQDGRAVLHRIRGAEALADVPVYLMSGSSEVRSLASGEGIDRIDGFFEKPLVLPKLLDTVAAVVRPARQPA